MAADNDRLKAPALDPAFVDGATGTIYPEQFKQPCEHRIRQALAQPLGLTQFGVNIVTLPPGCWSAQRHWHETEDEFVYVIDGHITLVSDDGPQLMGPGTVAGFAAGSTDGHHLINDTNQPARYLVVGTKVKQDRVVYPDIDLLLERKAGQDLFTDLAGKPY